MLSSLYAKGAVGLVIVLVIYFGYKYVVDLQQEAALWQAKATTLELVVESKEAVLKALTASIARQQEMSRKLEKELASARIRKDSSIKVFSNHDFRKLLSSKPGLLHNRMRSGTKRVFHELEEASRGN